MTKLIQVLNQNKLFKFVSSIRLAVPVMLLLIGAVAAGTIFESIYSAEYARIAIYDTFWFNIFLGFLGLNIFAAMMSRYPWKLRHLGFVITHIGILILLFGSFVTKVVGVDGSLQIQEGGTGNTVVLPDLMIAYQFDNSPSVVSVGFKKSLFTQDASDLSSLNSDIGHVLKVEKFMPFVELEKSYLASEDGTTGSSAVGIGFQMKSRFFDVKEWLHTLDQPVLQLGPATLKIILDKAGQTGLYSRGGGERLPAKESAAPEQVVVKDFKTGKELGRFTPTQLKAGVAISGVKIQVLKLFSRAIVSENKLTESGSPNSPANPAMELKLSKGKDTQREVLYGKYPQFSLNKDGVFGLRLEYQTGNAVSSDLGMISHNPHENESADPESPAMTRGGGPDGNTIEFHVNLADTSKVRVELWKAGKKIEQRNMREGETFQTPWMGMELYLASITVGAYASYNVKEVRPKAGGKSLPNAAVFVRPVGSDQAFWLSQGEAKSVQLAGRPASVMFSNRTLTLPFSLRLQKFTKKDYPGTETPYSYESLVRDEESGVETLISMNEPLKIKGYTLYQASFSMNPGEAPTSVLSVNQDPGRWIKYLGSLVLSLGIIIFTLMRSRFYHSPQSEGKKV